MTDRNKNFMEAFHHVKRQYDGIKTQKDFADFIGIGEDTMTNIKRHKADVSEETIAKLQEATNDMFNLNWLRGEVSRPMLAKYIEKWEEPRSIVSEDTTYPQPRPHEPIPAWADTFIQIISKQVTQIEELRSELRTYKKQISELTTQLADLTNKLKN